MNTQQAKRTLIVDDSPLFSQILSQIVNSVEGFCVCGQAYDAVQAEQALGQLRPDLIILDVRMPHIDGIQFLKKLIPRCPLPVIVCTSARSCAAKALSAGAADFVPKPSESSTDFEDFRRTLSAAMKNAVNLREIVCDGKSYKLKKTAVQTAAGSGLILIGGSAGSTEALPKLLASYSEDMPPVVCTIHMPEGYTEIFAKRLCSELNISAVEAKNGMQLKNGNVVIAQGAKHLRVYSSAGGLFVNSAAGERISGHCPSVDAMFMSAAELKNTHMVAVILTGMGHDGARGLLKLKKAGVFTIGQDESTSLVYGMPKEAYDIGAVCRRLPLDKIAAEIDHQVRSWSK